MRQINNGYAENYYLTDDGKVLNKETNRLLPVYGSHSYRLKKKDGGEQ